MSEPRHTLHIVSGKGGTGKTTVAGALAMALATGGRRVLLCEVEGRGGLAELFATTPLQGDEERRLLRTPAGGEVFGLSVDARDALTEYLASFYRLGLAGRALDRFGVYDFATSIAPGLRDVLLTGKVYEAVRRRTKGRPSSYDAVVLDAPPTGRIATFLNVHEAVSGLARVGPIHSQADSIMSVLRSSRTVVHLVTLLQDMPVTETLEALEELRPTGIAVGTIICNMVTPTPLTTETLAALEARPELHVPGLPPEQNEALAREFADELSALRDEQGCYERLRPAGLPLVELAHDPAGVDRAALHTLAGSLAEQLPEEVG
ncbi:AAA family ATPase [Auraticoccus sp. F435]|uniref:AAA family ATPase n=1 Tax=Auraticoccus cholistanensis TaxID=2656650 RepID=A0A6A9V173_9ACTN|nr:ArsA-related P-loop ATPase [Auraticoccus cholistanensis]MVA76919.1 AAA family ATPase [Auraticoccus cholistanensis]